MTGLADSALDGTASSTVTFPPSETIVAASFATVSFPPGVTASHVPADGLLVVRVSADVPADGRVQDALAYEGSGSVALRRIVEVGGAGAGPGRVAFDMPIRILLEGQAGGRAFYIEGGPGGAIVPIDAACAADDTERVHRQLGGSGECRIESEDGGGMVIYTYHLTLFGTAASEGGAPPPVYHTCSVGLGSDNLDIGDARLGGYSEPAEQTLINRGSAPFASVGIEASPWRAATGGGPPPPPPSAGYPLLPVPASGTGEGRASSALVAQVYTALPASATEVAESGRGGEGAYAPVGDGTIVARGLGGGDAASLWFRLNLTPYDEVEGGVHVQTVAYNVQCSRP